MANRDDDSRLIPALDKKIEVDQSGVQGRYGFLALLNVGILHRVLDHVCPGGMRADMGKGRVISAGLLVARNRGHPADGRADDQQRRGHHSGIAPKERQPVHNPDIEKEEE
jgi:hypothetical protein